MTVPPHRRSEAATSAAEHWRKSSRSTAMDACVEVHWTETGVLVRDSKDPDGPRLLVRSRAWAGFITGIPGWPGSTR